MNVKIYILILFGGWGTIHALNGQSLMGSIKGRVTDSLGMGLYNAQVYLKNTSYQTMSNENGDFVLHVAYGDYSIIVKHIGYRTYEMPVRLDSDAGINLATIIMAEESEVLPVLEIPYSKGYLSNRVSPTLRLNLPLLEVPQNIQVVSAEALGSQQIFDMLEGTTRNVSGAQKVEHWDNYARIHMRGSQLTAFRNGMNVVISPWSPLAEDMSMVERIEFVKGPAGFMLSTGEPSGFYNVVTKKPSGRDRKSLTLTTGSFDLYRSTIDIEGNLSKQNKLTYRLNLMGQLKGSHRDYEFNNRYSIVPVLRYKVSDQSFVTMEYTQQYSQMNVIGSNYAFSRKKYADLPMNFSTAEPNLSPTNIVDRSMQVTFEHQWTSEWKLTAQAAYFHHKQIGQSLWPYAISSVNDSLMQRGISIWDALGQNKTMQIFVNGKMITGAISHSLLAGIDGKYSDYFADWNQGAALGDSTFNIYDPTYGTVSTADIPIWDRSRDIRERGVRYNGSYNALYLQDQLGFLNNKIRLTLAGRYTTLTSVNPYSGDTKDGRFTPRLGLSISPLKFTSVYALADQSFLQNPGTDWRGNTFDPVTATCLEAGLKRDWANGKWNSVVSIYQITRENVLTADLDHPHPVTGQFVFSKQTGQQEVQGIEVDLKGELLPNLDLIINYAYTDARITKDSDPDIIGKKVAGATKHIQNAWLTYKFVETLKGWSISSGYQFQSGRSSLFINDQTSNALPDYFRLDVALAYQINKFNVQLNINNLLNEYLYSGAPYGSLFYWQTEPGRNARFSLSYSL